MPSNFNTPYDQDFKPQEVEKQPIPRVPQGTPLVGSGMSHSFGEENIGLQFAPYGGFKSIDENVTNEDLQDLPEYRADEQSGLQLIGNALGQTATELTLGAVESAGYTLDLPGVAESVLGVENEFDNKFSRIFREAKEAINEKYFPIYQSKAALSGDFLDATSIAANFKNLASTATLMLPAIGAARGLSLFAKMGEEARLSRLMAKGLSLEQAVAKDAKMVNTAQTIAAAAVSRHGEDTMESQQFMSQYKNQLLSKYQPEAEAKVMARINKLPLVKPFDPERTDNYTQEDRRRDEEKILSEEKTALDKTIKDKLITGARNVYKADGALLAVDVLQYIPLFSGLGNAAKALSIPKGLVTAGQVVSEAGEEGFQSANQLEAYNAMTIATPFYGPGFSERLGDYLKDADLQTSMVWGAAGAGVFMGAGPAARKAIELGQDFNLSRARSSQMGDVHTFDKLTDEVKTDLIKKHARRDRLDDLNSELQGLKSQLDDQDWESIGTTREDAEKTIDSFSEDIAYAKEQKGLVDNNEFFVGKDDAKIHYLDNVLSFRSNARIIDNIKKENDELFSNLVSTNSIPTELSNEKKMLTEIEALKKFQKNLKKIPSFQRNEGLRSNVSNKITLKIQQMETILNEMLKSYETLNPGVNAKETLVTPLDKKILDNRLKSLELETVQNSVIKPTIDKYNSKAFVDQVDKEEKSKKKEAVKKNAKKQAEEAETPADIKTVKEAAESDSEVKTVVDEAVTTKAAEQKMTAPQKLKDRYTEAPHLFEEEQKNLTQYLLKEYENKMSDTVDNNIGFLSLSATPEEFIKNIKYIMDARDTGNPLYKELYDKIETFFKEEFDLQDAMNKTAPEQSVDTDLIPNEEPEAVDEEQEEPIEPSEESSSDIDYILSDERTKPVENSGTVIAPMRKYTMTKTGRIVKDAKIDSLGQSMGIDFDYANNPNALQVGSEILFSVNIDVVIGETQDAYHKGLSKDEFVNKFQVLMTQVDVNGNTHVVNALPIYDGSQTKEALLIKKMREDIYSQLLASKQTAGTHNSTIATKVTKKYAGRLNTTKAKNNPHEVLSEGSKLIFGIAVRKGTKVSIEAGKNVTDHRYDSIDIPEKHVGKIFMLIEGANGKIIPALCFTKNINDTKFVKARTYVLNQLKNSNKTNWVENRRNVQDVIGIKYFYIPSEDKFKTPDGKKYTKDQLEQMIDGKVLNVRLSKINTGDYNNTISRQGRLSIDLKPGEPISNTNFEFSVEYFHKNEVSNANEVAPEVAPVIDEAVEPTIATPESTEKSEHPSTQPEQEDFKELDGGIDLGDIGDLNLRKVTVTEGEFYQKWDKVKEEKWFKERFGNEEESLFAIKEGLIEINKNGGIQAWGQFKNAIAYISSVAATGTTYHEAFHVVFHLYLNDRQRAQIIKEGRSRGYTGSDIEVEEAIADGFMEYIQSEESETKGLGSKIIVFFKKLYYMIKSGITKDISINELFYRAQHKMYKNKKFSRDISKFGIERERIAGYTVYQEQRRITALADQMRQAIDDIVAVRPDLASLPRMEIVRALAKVDKTGKSSGLDVLMKTAYNRIVRELSSNKSLTDEQKAGLKLMLKHFISVDANGNVIKGDLGKRAVRQFARTEGVTISGENDEIRSFNESTEDTDVDLGEEQTKAEGWQTKAEEMSGKESLSKEVRKVLNYIPVINEKLQGPANYETDDLGFTVYHDFNAIYGFLKRELSGIIDSADMMERLSQIALEKPYMAQILSSVRNNELLKTKFYVDFAKSHVDLKTIKEERTQPEDGKDVTNVKIISSNRVMVFRMLIDEWKMNSKNPTNNKILNQDKTINAANAAKVVKAIDVVKAQAKDLSSLDNAFLKKIRDIANYMGMSITVDDLAQLNIDRNFLNEDNEVRVQTGKSKVMKLFGQIETLAMVYNEGKDPFDASATETKTIEELSRTISKFRQELMESSFRTRRGKETKTIYSHQVPAFLARQINEFKSKDWKNKLAFYTETPFYATSPWLADLAESMNRDIMEFVEIDNLQYASDNNDSDSIPYVNMSQRDYEFTTLNMFFNNGSETPYYRFPVVSDAPKMLFVRFKRYEGKDILNTLYKVYQQEQARIDDVVSRKKQRKELEEAGLEIPEELLPIEHYDTDKSEKFILLPFLNNGHNAKVVRSKDPRQIKEAIKTWLTEEKESDYNRLVKLGVLGENVKLDSRIASKYSDQKAFHADYFYNSIIANTQMTTIFSGDPAFYKADRTARSIYSRTVDFQKRNKQNVSPALRIDPSAVYHFTEDQAKIEGRPFETVGDTYNSIYLKDQKIISKHGETILNALLANNIEPNRAYEIASNYGYANKWMVEVSENNREYFTNKDEATEFAKSINKQPIGFASAEPTNPDVPSFKSSVVNVTDAQAYITPQRLRRVMIGLGRWTKQHQDIYPKMLNGTLSGEELQVVLQPMKPFYFGHSRIGNLMVPTQNKNSEFLLLPQLVKGSPELTKLYNHMTENGIDSANFESAVKVGGFGITSIDNLDKVTVHKLNNKDYGLQQETPEHYLDAHTLFGTQIRKLIMADISDNAMFTVPWQDKPMSKRDLFNLYQDIILEDLRAAYQKVSERIGTKEDVAKLLKDEIQNRDLGEELEKALELIQTANDMGIDEKNFRLPLYHPLHARRIESLLNSVFKNGVTKQKISGGAFVQLSSFGFSEKLNLKISDGRIEYAECMLPWWSKKYFQPLLDEKGQLDINRVPSDLLEMIGYRIPTEDKYSMLPLRVVGFMPANSGGAVMLPMEITTIAGSDFDIDKMYIMMPEFEKFGSDIIKVKYDGKKSAKDNSQKARNNAKVDIIKSVLTNKDTFSKFISPGGYSTLADEAKVIKTAEGKIDEMLSLVLPSTQTELFNRNMTGKQLVGIFASHNANHAVLQYSDVRLEKSFEFNGMLRNSLHDVYDVNGNYISKNVAEFLAAVVDNAKDPISSFVNLNTYTADVAALILRTGFPISTAVRFLSQPILKEFTEKYFNEGGDSSAEKKAIKYIKDKYNMMPGEEIKPTFEKRSPSDEELLKEISGTPNDENQKYMFEKFLSLKEQGQSLTSLVAAMRADTKGVGPTLSENEALLNNIDSVVKSKELTGQAELFYGNIIGPLISGNILNIKKITEIKNEYFKSGSEIVFFSKHKNEYDTAILEDLEFIEGALEGATIRRPDGQMYMIDILDILSVGGKTLQDLIEQDNPYKMISGFTTYGVDLPTKELSKFFPWFNQGFRGVKSILAAYTKGNKLSVDQIEKINYGLLAYISSGFEFFNGSDRGVLVNNITDTFKSLKEANKGLFENNFFLNKLVIEEANDPALPKRLSFKNTGSLTAADKQMVAESWQEAMQNPETAKFAKDLVKYSFYTSGFNVTPNSFWHLIPVEFFDTLTDSNNQTFNNYLKRKMSEGENSSTVFNGFVDQFIANNANDLAFVPSVDTKFKNISGQVVNIKGMPAYFEINAKDKNIKDKSLFQVVKGGAIFPEYLSYKYLNKTYLFKLEDTGNPYIAVYTLEEKLGSPNNFVEYAYDGIARSSLTKNKHFEGKFQKAALVDYAISKVMNSDSVRVAKDQPEQDVVTPINTGSYSGNPKDFTNYSGAAIGGDTEWAKAGAKFGIGRQVDYTTATYDKLTDVQKAEVESAYIKAAKDLGRNILQKNSYAGKLVRRDYLQAKSADSIFAISTIIEPGDKDKKGYVNKTNKQIVEGGTGYAVQMGINLGKTVYVFDQLKNKWFMWNGSNFTETETPTLTTKFAGIGTREINDSGKKAILDVFEKSFNAKSLQSAEKDVSLDDDDKAKFNQLKAQIIMAEELTQKQLDKLKAEGLTKEDLYNLQPTANNYGILRNLTC